MSLMNMIGYFSVLYIDSVLILFCIQKVYVFCSSPSIMMYLYLLFHPSPLLSLPRDDTEERMQ